MKVKVKINNAVIKKVKDTMNEALVETADALLSDLKKSQTMPFDTGALQNRSTFVDASKKKIGRVSIVSDTPYARRLYFHPEYNFNKVENPNAGAKWFEPYIDGNKKDFATNAFMKFIKDKMR